jgi:hypothetical protein
MRSLCIAFTLALVVAPIAASADGIAFVGPASWSSNGPASSSGDASHQFSQWHLPGDSAASLTFLQTTTSYADSLAAIHANFTANKIKPAVDKDVPCQGKVAHVIEFATGPADHKVVINRMIVPSGDGVAALTYSREDGTTFDPDVAKAESAYCAAAS